MQWVYGDLPDAIFVERGVRVIVYNEAKAIIKSSSDSMEAHNDSLQYQGYMGIWSKNTHFTVKADGLVYEVDE